MINVFLAYPHNEKELAVLVARTLSEEGISVWFDEHQIRPGDEIASSVRHGLESSSAVVLLLGTQNYGDSWARRETALALSQGKKIFPVLPRRDSEVPYLLRHLSYLDLSDKTKRHENLRKLAKAIATSSPDSPEQPKAQHARSKAIEASAMELEAEMREYQNQSVKRNWSLARGSIVALVSTVTTIAVLLFGLDSTATSKYFYIALGVIASLVAHTVGLAVGRFIARRSQNNMKVEHE